ncbi:MAG: UDP-glucose/GDP-mannose dehydrogenase family protein [Rickettsiales bacterium]|nr:UDP-glucose/GDP-mannose dehydrogenase family protein [Pseudomonadota bacterium]MDA0967296.1 UDP-glucose/GDP-mannose dehydrogenase family protein [Pseudomonadota bacterium]MDG4544043.1 UDP-glucose/GDP-mannose dehydrogenase family protein [Rickettsiales bacterium]MDG4546263.1 UDP-glucose/GDP-mannose dehydrogenase family protein [Rickettsiales bacterium]MDG4548367.1 UDP-glucose/GDP-mannose dehydrogenase family protein [Rickettsiales bacterium]
MKVVVIGTGYVGLVSGACFADMGHNVVCVDKDENKIQKLLRGEIPIYEPGLDEIVKRNSQNGRLNFSKVLSDVIHDAQVVLLAVGTPTDASTGRADLQYVFAAAQEVADNLSSQAVIVTKSTVPVGTGAKVLQILKSKCEGLLCDVASNPEFLREGAAIEDFMKPDRIVVGCETEFSQNVMSELYKPLIDKGTPILFTNIPTAELIKYASNAFLATKIAFANEISDICEGVGANVDLVIKGMGMDNRIGGKYMQPGPGYGGSCFPKDTMALTHIATDAGFPTKIVESVINSNDDRRKRMVSKIVSAAGGSVAGLDIGILGLTFKANTDDMRYSPSTVIISQLLAKGANISVYDPEGMNEAKKELTQESIIWCKTARKAIMDSDIVVIITEWDEFKNLDISEVKKLMKGNIVVDLRNILDAKAVEQEGLRYICLGK